MLTMLSNLEELEREGVEVDLVVVGRSDPVACASRVHEFIPCNGVNLLGVIARLVLRKGYDVYHAFDEFAFFFARLMSLRANSRVLYTRCGGASPTNRYSPRARDVVCLSRENFEYFQLHRRRNDRIILMPGRVPEFEISLEAQIELLAEANCKADEVVVMRIARITRYYEKSILQTIKLAQVLQESGIRARAIIIGKPYDESMTADLRRRYPDAFFACEERFSTDARRLLGCADLVVGTGRSFMEGAMAGKIMLAPNQASELALLATPDTIEDLFSMNFSERSNIEADDRKTVEELLKLISHDDLRNRYSDWIRGYAEAHFSSRGMGKRLLELYSDCRRGRYAYLDLIRHGARVFSVFVRHIAMART